MTVMDKDILRALKIAAAIMAAPLWLAVLLWRLARRLPRIRLLLGDSVRCDACGQRIDLVGVFTCPQCRLTAPGFYFAHCRLCGSVPDFIRCPACGVCMLNPLAQEGRSR
jgi:hypothetical protein